MLTALVSLLAAIGGIILWWLKRKKSPERLAAEQKQKINEAIAKGSEHDVNVLLDDGLDRVRDKNSRDSSR